MTDAIALEDVPHIKPRRVYYGWVNLVIAAMAMVATLPGRPQGLGLITEPLIRDFHITPLDYAFQNFWATLIGSSFCLACGPLIDRLGARTVITAILALLAGSVMGMSRAVTPRGLLITMLLTRGFGQSALSVVSLTLVGKWFSRRLPMAMGVYAVVSSIGFVILWPGLLQAVMRSDWRNVWGWMGAIMLVVFMPIAFLLVRRTPESIGLPVDGMPALDAGPASTTEAAETGLTLPQAIATPAFWAFAAATSAYAMVSSALMLFQQRILAERGFDVNMLKVLMPIIMLAAMVANFGGGWLGTRVPIGRLMSGAMLLLGFSLFSLPIARGKVMVCAYAGTMGLATGLITVLFYTCWGKLFGRRHLGAIQGLGQLLTVVATALGPVLLAWSVDKTGSSARMLFILAPVMGLIGIVCALTPMPKLPKLRGFPVNV